MGLLSSNNSKVKPVNTDLVFRETFEAYDTSAVWDEVKNTTDIIQLEGNANGSSYLTISKDPLVTDTVSTVTSVQSFECPIELTTGIHLSQRTLGQEFAFEMINDDTTLTPFSEKTILSITQATTTLTVVTATAHGMVPGYRFGIYGVADSRLNYQALVVASVPNSTTFTATGGPAGTIASLSVGPYTNQGQVYARPSLNYATEGASQIFENASATNASFYVRSDVGDVIASGTAAGSHAATISSTASVASINGAGAYAFQPTTEQRFSLQPDRIQFSDSGVDSTSAQGSRLLRTQLVPSNSKKYKLRFRFTNNKSLPVPTAKIISAVKTGTTTATITTDVPHNLTTSDFVTVYGIGDTVNFPNVTTSVIVSTVINSTQVAVIIAGAVSATSYGGLISRSQGSLGIQGVSAIAAQLCTVGGGQLTLQGIGTWTGFVIGDFVNVHGVRNRTTGADLAVDGVYRVQNLVSSVVTLEPINGATLPADMTSVQCGGCIIKRTDARISFVRGFKYERERVEVMPRPDAAAAVPVNMVAGTIGSGTISTLSNGFLAFNQSSTDVASGAITTTATSASIVPTAGALTHQFNMIVTATSGTPTLDFVIQESDDSGTNWYDIYHFPRITAAGQYRSPLIPLVGNRIRYVRTVGGGTPSITASINRSQSHITAPLQRQFFDRTLVVNTISSVTPSFFIEGCNDLNVMVAMGAVTTTAPVLVLEISPDNATWVQVGADITTAASTNNLLQVTNALGRFARIRVKTAGNGATMTFLMVKGIGR